MLNLPGSVRDCIVSVGLDVRANGKEYGITPDSMRQCRPLSLQDYDNGF